VPPGSAGAGASRVVIHDHPRCLTLRAHIAAELGDQLPVIMRDRSTVPLPEPLPLML
jgi:hypothetical protein